MDACETVLELQCNWSEAL